MTGLGSLTGSTSTATTYNAPASVAASALVTPLFTATSVTEGLTKSVIYTVNLAPPPQISTMTMGGWKRERRVQFCSEYDGRRCAPIPWAIMAAPTGLTLSSSTTNSGYSPRHSHRVRKQSDIHH